MTERPTPSPAVGYAAAITAAALFAWLGPLSRWAYERGMEPLPFVAWRAGIGVLVLLLVVAGARGRREAVSPARPGRRDAAALVTVALMALLLNLSIFGAFDRVTVALALIGFYTYPALVAVVAIALGREQPTRPILLALGLALTGMVVVVAGSLDPRAGLVVDPVGLLFALAAAVSQTVFVTVSRDGYPMVPAEQATALILAGTVAGCLVLGLTAGLGQELLAPVRSPELLPIVAAAGALGAAVPSLLFLTAIRRIGGTPTGILMLLEPVIGVALAAVLLGEGLRGVQVAGAAAVLAAALLLQRSSANGRNGTVGAPDDVADGVAVGPRTG